MAWVRTAAPGRARAFVRQDSSSPGDGTSDAEEVVGCGQARERILDAAEDLFAADGFDATPTAHIAGRAVVAKGLLFYYFPRKMDLLRALFAERLPTQSLSSLTGIAVQGDVAGSLVRLADRIGLTGQHCQVLSAIAFREASTHPDVRDHLRNLYSTLMELTEAVLDAASSRKLDHGRRTAAAGTFVAVMLHQANSHRFNGPTPDLGATAEIVSGALLARQGRA
jgi:AcrR family transcriptional regulator